MREKLFIVSCVLITALLTQSCATHEDNRNLGLGIAAALAVGAGVYIAKHPGGGGGYVANTDYEWDWDEFYNEQHQLVWACRGVQSGQFAEEWHCASKLKTDYRWPNK